MKAIGERRSHIALALIGAIAWSATMAAIVIIFAIIQEAQWAATASVLGAIVLAAAGFPALIAVISSPGNDDPRHDDSKKEA